MLRAPVVLRGRPSGAVLARTRLDTGTHLAVVIVAVALLIRIVGLFLLGGALGHRFLSFLRRVRLRLLLSVELAGLAFGIIDVELLL